jgi:multiple sugar transport system permease protein
MRSPAVELPGTSERTRDAAGMRRFASLDSENPLVAYLFLLPHAVLFVAFVVYPIVSAISLSLHRYNPLAKDQAFVGLLFYQRIFDFSTPEAANFWRSVAQTAFFTAIVVPILIALALFLALLLQRPILGRGAFRTIFFVPTVLSVSVIAILWRWMTADQFGLVNIVLRDVGLPSIPFVTREWLAWIPIIVATTWWTVGFNMTLYLAALASIPESYYEAAELDGAGAWGRFRHITFPLLMPATMFVAITTVLASLQLYGQSQLITNGGPTRTTQSAMMVITEQAFTNHQLSSATAMSLVFGIVLVVFAAFQFRLMSSRVRAASR